MFLCHPVMMPLFDFKPVPTNIKEIARKRI